MAGHIQVGERRTHMWKYSNVLLLCCLCIGCRQDVNLRKFDSTVNSLEKSLKTHPTVESLMSIHDAWGRTLVLSSQKGDWLVLFSQGPDVKNDKDDIRIRYNVQTGAFDITANYQDTFYANGFFPE